MWLTVLLSGCVVGVTDRFCVDEPVDVIRVDVGQGDVAVSAAPRLCVEVDLHGPSTQPVAHGVQGTELLLSSDCVRCGGEVRITAPRGVDLDVTVGTGDVYLEGRGAEVYATVGAGHITAVDMVSGWTELASGEGRVDAEWIARPERVGVATSRGKIDLAVPTGVYVLDLMADTGSVEVSGIEEVGFSDAQIAAVAARGSISLRGR